MSERYAFRQARAADAAAVRVFARRAYARWVPVLGREPKPMAADYEAALRRHRIDLLLEGERSVGLIETVPEPCCLVVENVALDPAYQGRGLGRLLMARAEALAAEAGLGALRLYTNALMEANIRLYASLGYAVDRGEETRDGRTIVHMSKRLAAPAPAGDP